MAQLKLLLALALLSTFTSNLTQAKVIAINGDGQLFTAEHDTFVLSNLKRDATQKDKTDHVTMKFVLKGTAVSSANPKKVIPWNSEKEGKWYIDLSDETTSVMTVHEFAGAHQFQFDWPGNPEEQEDDRELCFYLGKDVKWYNTFQQLHQKWPMDLSTRVDKLALNALQNVTTSEIQYIVEHLFLGSNGFAILLNNNDPLWYRLDPNGGDPLLCITSQAILPYNPTNKKPYYTSIRFSIFAGANIKETYKTLSLHSASSLGFIPRPTEVPDEHMFSYPIWTIIPGKSKDIFTDADLNMEKLIIFAKHLKKHDLRHSVFSLDTWWQVKDNYLIMETNKQIRDPRSLATQLMQNERGYDYRLELVISPFVHRNAGIFTDNKDFFIKNSSNGLPYVIRDEGPQKDHAIMDFSNQKASDWFVKRLTQFQVDYNVTSFVFEPITTFDLHYKLASTDAQDISGTMGAEYVKLAGKLKHGQSNSLASVKEGHGTQDVPVFVHMSPRVASWEDPRGIKSLIPTALTLSLAGYSFFIPDLIGGREGAADKELYIRWAQVCTFMPAMQFATPPWDFDTETEDITMTFINKHIENSKEMVALARERVNGEGTPVLRPMWWVAPEDVEMYSIDDQFMVGDSLLVAPILAKGQTKRDVYFPDGTWKGFDGKQYTGPGRQSVEATLQQLPYFNKTT